jgi:hypothetical protein
MYLTLVTPILTHTHTHTYIYIYVHTHIYMYMYVLNVLKCMKNTVTILTDN